MKKSLIYISIISIIIYFGGGLYLKYSRILEGTGFGGLGLILGGYLYMILGAITFGILVLVFDKIKTRNKKMTKDKIVINKEGFASLYQVIVIFVYTSVIFIASMYAYNVYKADEVSTARKSANSRLSIISGVTDICNAFDKTATFVATESHRIPGIGINGSSYIETHQRVWLTRDTLTIDLDDAQLVLGSSCNSNIIITEERPLFNAAIIMEYDPASSVLTNNNSGKEYFLVGLE